MPLGLLFCVWLPTVFAIRWRLLRDRQQKPRAYGDPKSFLVVRLDELGDLVLTTPLFRELKRRYPGSKCTVVVREKFRQVLTTNPHIDEILTVPKISARWIPSRLKTLLSVGIFCATRLHRKHFDVAVSPRWDVDEHLATLMCIASGAERRVGYSAQCSAAKYKINRGFDVAFTTCLGSRPLQHEVLRNLAVVEALTGSPAESSHLEIRLSNSDERIASGLLADVAAGTVKVALGIGARSANRRWPVQRFAEVVALLESQFPVQAIIICAPQEQPLAQELGRQLCRTPLVLSGSIRQACAVLKQSDLFIGNDSGAAHLAAAVDCKVVVVSRHAAGADPNHPHSPARFSPWCKEKIVVTAEATVTAGTSSRSRTHRHGDVRSISPSRVAEAALRLLRGEKPCSEQPASPTPEDAEPALPKQPSPRASSSPPWAVFEV